MLLHPPPVVTGSGFPFSPCLLGHRREEATALTYLIFLARLECIRERSMGVRLTALFGAHPSRPRWAGLTRTRHSSRTRNDVQALARSIFCTWKGPKKHFSMEPQLCAPSSTWAPHSVGVVLIVVDHVSVAVSPMGISCLLKEP